MSHIKISFHLNSRTVAQITMSFVIFQVFISSSFYQRYFMNPFFPPVQSHVPDVSQDSISDNSTETINLTRKYAILYTHL